MAQHIEIMLEIEHMLTAAMAAAKQDSTWAVSSGSGPLASFTGSRPLPACSEASSAARTSLAARGARHHPAGMFVVSEAEATAIRIAFDRGGELSAAVELRRLFPGVTDNAQARECARIIAGWKPMPAPLCPRAV